MLFLLCLKIFIARLIDVSLGTFRTINTVKGKNLIAALIGLVEIIVWFLVVKEALSTENNSMWIVISYALGFSVGTYIGGIISKLFIKTNLEVQVVLSNNDNNIVKRIRKEGYGVTLVSAYGANSKKNMLYIQIRNKSLKDLKRLLNELDNKAFIVVNEAKYVENGYFSVEK